jgi:hypothetical protein
MKPRRTWPLRIFIAALVVIVLAGAYMAIAHREARPQDSSTPAPVDGRN